MKQYQEFSTSSTFNNKDNSSKNKNYMPNNYGNISPSAEETVSILHRIFSYNYLGGLG